MAMQAAKMEADLRRRTWRIGHSAGRSRRCQRGHHHSQQHHNRTISNTTVTRKAFTLSISTWSATRRPASAFHRERRQCQRRRRVRADLWRAMLKHSAATTTTK
eukprot:3293845-Rhodomonas_salina.1